MFHELKKFIFACALTGFLLLAVFPVPAQKPCGPPPKAERHRIKGGEGFPPLPLPVTPLRRTEKKRPPSPPTLMGKINYGEAMVGVRPDGSTYKYYNWTNVPGDTKGLFNLAQKALGVDYKADVVRMNGFSYQPDEVPIMYFSGFEKISFTAEEREKIRRFALQGGFVFGDPCCGTGPFEKSFREEMQTIFPDRPWQVFPAEHPLYSCFTPVGTVAYYDDGKEKQTQAAFEGLNIGCRAAVIFSPYDLSCGWGGEIYPEGRHVAIHDARMMGLNILTYCLAYYRLGRDMSISRVYREDTAVPGEIVLGQVMHDGDWDTAPNGIQNLMRFISQNTTGNVVYRRKAVNLAEDDLTNFPFLYLTGHLDFHFGEVERSKLKEYLQRGGFLLICDCCNRKAFEQAVQRELKALFPDKTLTLIPDNHSVYQNPYRFGADVSADTEKSFREILPLYGINHDGFECVIYSPRPIGCAWDKSQRPYIDVPEPELALSIGANIITYAMTH